MGGGDDEWGEIDAGRYRQHVFDESLVARHIDDAEAEVAQIQRGEADVDGDAAFLLLRQPVAVDAGECLDERSLTVVDMTGRTENQIARHGGTPLSPL